MHLTGIRGVHTAFKVVEDMLSFVADRISAARPQPDILSKLQHKRLLQPGQGLYNREKARQEEKTDGPSVGQKRRLETLVEDALTDQQQMCKRAQAVLSILKQLREEGRSIAEKQLRGDRVLFAGAHASFAALRDRACPGAELHRERA